MTRLRIVVVADPLPTLRPHHDYTVALIEAAQPRGHTVLVTTADRLRVRDTRAHAACRPVTVVPATLADGRWSAVADWWCAGEERDVRLDDVDVDVEPIGAVRRIAAPGEFRCNMAAGAAVVADEVTAVDKHICAALAPELARLGLAFTGIDVIGDRLTEVNVTSPTRLREIDALSGTRLPDLVVDYLERRVRER